MPRDIYTVGYGTRPADKFVDLLKNHSVEAIVDIRRWPTSKTPWFKKESLVRILGDAGIQYVWKGEKLGGFRSGGYSAYMMTAQFESGYSSLIRLATRKMCALMCLEISPRGCHRRFISQRLADEGWSVIHILSDKRPEQHQTLFPQQVHLSLEGKRRRARFIIC